MKKIVRKTFMNYKQNYMYTVETQHPAKRDKLLRLKAFSYNEKPKRKNGLEYRDDRLFVPPKAGGHLR